MSEYQTIVCHDCGVLEGQIHNYGCDTEYCPFCGFQLIGCMCCYGALNLINHDKYPDTSGLPPKIYENGLEPQMDEQWKTFLSKTGRIPFIDYPNICIKCGKLWPELFGVPDEEWQRYIQPDMRKTVICRECYEEIKELIDRYHNKEK